MNRYSLIFAVLIASTFAVRPTQSGDGTAKPGSANIRALNNDKAPGTKRNTAHNPGNLKAAQPLSENARDLIQWFLDKAAPSSEPKTNLQILFATVPHPVETHLAAAFDHNVDAIQDGLQAAGYLFDSSWIPWSQHEKRDSFDDDEKEKQAKDEEDRTPGVLLFRRHSPDANAQAGEPALDPYAHGILVFLISEKPTEGIADSQVINAVTILGKMHFAFTGQIRILGPTFSGSFASMVTAVEYLENKIQKPKGGAVKRTQGGAIKKPQGGEAQKPKEGVLIRSGAATVGDAAVTAMREIAAKSPKAWIDFGSVNYDNSDWTRAAIDALHGMGIEPPSIATLSEGESLYGYAYLPVKERGNGIWNLPFPRDISSLRTDYEQQGLLDPSSPPQPWKRFLNLKSDAESDGDSVRSLGGASTVETQEAILLGISEFLKTHPIRAAVISATNEEDRLFLTQFLHVHNPGVRVVVIGTTRVFMRGRTAQFRGDLMVDSFPMLPRLQDWTGIDGDRSVRIFADDVAEGTYFAALDLFGEPTELDSYAAPKLKYKWYPEYSEPNWRVHGVPVQQPPMYVVALGSNSTWPVAESLGSPFLQDDTDPFLVEMPFTLFERDHPSECERENPPTAPKLHVSRDWRILGTFVVLLIFLYCLAIWYANPISRDAFASFEPSEGREYWMLKVALPAAAAGGACWVMGWAVAIPQNASPNAVMWWWVAEAATVLAPLAILGSAVCKARFKIDLSWDGWMIASISITVAAAAILCIRGVVVANESSRNGIGSILNTYREMHWESGLSLVPTWLLFLLAIAVWASQAGNGAAALSAASPLPNFSKNERISNRAAYPIVQAGVPWPSFRELKWLWIAWSIPASLLAFAYFRFGPFTEVTTLDSKLTTSLTRLAASALAAVVLFDVLQFLWLWDELQLLLRALNRETFKRSFGPIHTFDWRSLWSFTGVSFQSRRATNTALIDSLLEIPRTHEFEELHRETKKLKDGRDFYNTCDLSRVRRKDYLNDRRIFFGRLKWAGTWVANYLDQHPVEPVPLSPETEAIQRGLSCRCKGGDGGHWNDEEEELARLPDWLNAAEQFLCLMYIGFIQTVIARLHTLLVAIASMYSLLALGIAIYPFVPVSPLLVIGGVLLIVIALAFFKVFSQMDKDPILSRIVDGDDRKLQGSFYLKFAEAMALPLLTAGSSLLPGGVGRLLELIQELLGHSSS
jgi:hypothetical protein